jgi:hypothetical protein
MLAPGAVADRFADGLFVEALPTLVCLQHASDKRLRGLFRTSSGLYGDSSLLVAR